MQRLVKITDEMNHEENCFSAFGGREPRVPQIPLEPGQSLDYTIASLRRLAVACLVVAC
jgi:hypothetical protein